MEFMKIVIYVLLVALCLLLLLLGVLLDKICDIREMEELEKRNGN